jgi:hypothetical protein
MAKATKKALPRNGGHIVAAVPGPAQEEGQTETRSHTKIRVSPGAIERPAPRSP